MNRVVHFEIHVDDIERAKKFYGDIFGWKFEDWSEYTGGNTYWGITTGEKEDPGIDGGMLKRPCAAPKEGEGMNGFVCTIQVDDYDAYHDKILAAGGKVALPKAAIPQMAWQGYYIDTQGNTFGLHQADKNAK